MKDDIMELLLKSGAILKGHFLLTSGLHSDTYVQCAKLFQYPNHSEAVSRTLAKRFEKESIDVVIGPAIGGIILSYETARVLGTRGIFAERESGKMVLKRGFQIKEGEKVLVVEDVITTGGSVKEVIEVVRSLGGNVIAVASIVDRSTKPVDFGVRFESLIKITLNTYPPDECPMCKSGIKIEKPGSREKIKEGDK